MTGKTKALGVKVWEALFRALLLPVTGHSVNRLLSLPDGSSQIVRVVNVAFMPWAYAMTIGTDIYTRMHISALGSKEASALLEHEGVHVWQWKVYGGSFIHKYVIAGVKALLSGKRYYSDNPFEIQAYKHEYCYRRLHGMEFRDRYAGNKDD